MKGCRNHNSKPKEYYAENYVRRENFKATCKNQGWNFEDFEEVWKGDKDSRYNKKYYYIYKRE